ncbi:MAG: cation:proton antiporter [Bryobacteraceae bacterium]
MVDLFKLILQIAVVILAGRIGGLIFQKLKQPQVVGEMAAGILLGPSLMGWVAPGFSAALFPPSSLGHLNALSQVGLILFMFLVGLSLNPKELHENGHAAVLTSHVSIVSPFCLGSILALFLYPRLSDDSVSFLGFMLFMGAAMSITAFPVLARILGERNMLKSRLGTLSIACAAVDDVTGWCILAYIVFLIRAAHGSLPIWMTLGGSALFVVVMVFGVRKLLPRFESSFRKNGKLTDQTLAVMVLLVLASALATEALGIHLLFGAFLVGAIMPKSEDFIHHITQKLEAVTVVVLLPLFFAYSGLRTRIGLEGSGKWWLYAALVIVVAIAGKLGGSMFAARFAGMSWRDSASLGILMNTRGLMELVILNIGLDIGVISSGMFSMMVLMALVTTFMTTPLLHLVYPERLITEERIRLMPERVA